MDHAITVKAMIFLKRREDMTLDEFKAWWLEEHRALAEKLPGLRRHVFNLLSGDPYDAIVEQWFDTEQSMIRSYDSGLGRNVVANSMQHISARDRVIVQEYAFDIGGRDKQAPSV